MINWSTLIKKFMQTYIVIVSGSILNASTVHLNGIWHLIWRYISKPVLGGHPVLRGHYSIPRGCPLNTGFTVWALKMDFKKSLVWLALAARLSECRRFLFIYFFLSCVRANRDVCTQAILERVGPILGDPGAVSRVGRKGGTKVFK